MVEENTYFTDQLSPLEGYPLTLCDVSSRINAGRLSISIECLIGILHILYSRLGTAIKL